MNQSLTSEYEKLMWFLSCRLGELSTIGKCFTVYLLFPKKYTQNIYFCSSYQVLIIINRDKHYKTKYNTYGEL